MLKSTCTLSASAPYAPATSTSTPMKAIARLAVHTRDEEESPQIQSELTSIQGREYQIASVALPLMRQAVMARIPGGNTYGLPAHTIAYIGDALTQVRCARRNCVVSDHE
jgi:hypothetical protein